LQLIQNAGATRIADHVAHLSRALVDGARRLGFSCKTPDDTVGPLVVIEAHDAARVVAVLAENNLVGSSRLDGVRVSLHLYNTMSDVDAVLDVLERNANLLVRSCDQHMVRGAKE
jgi:selenocysteine lyase/cysteine desulfurase